MPPKRGKKTAAAAPATPPLDGCNVALSGLFPGFTQGAVEKDFVVPLGGTLVKSVTLATTHLITNETDYTKPSAKVKQAKDANLHIVSLQWLQDCKEKSSRLNETDYGFGNNSGPKANGALKRTASTSGADNTADTKPTKKAKGAASSNGDKAVDSAPAKTAEAKKVAEFGEGQIATKDAKIPLDEYCPFAHHHVHVDDGGIIYDASLNQTNSGNNNNKFYIIQLLHNGGGDYRTWTRWGRVGDRGQSAELGDGSLADAFWHFNKKFKDKSGLSWDDRAANPKPGKYTFLEKSYVADSDDEGDAEEDAKDEKPESAGPKSTLAVPVQELMQLIFNQQYFAATMSELNYDVKKLPLGKLSKSTIIRGYQALKDLSEIIDDPELAGGKNNASWAAATENLSNTYFSLIPHAFGRNRPPIIRDDAMLKREIELLESLADMKDATTLMKEKLKNADEEMINKLDSQFQGLGLEEMTPLKRDGAEYKHLKNYLMDSRGATHGVQYQISDIFRIERKGEKARFDTSPFAGPPRDRRLLWHGSRATNFGGILSQGLRIAPPEAPVSGYMFGKGMYLADMSSKSANYCCAGASNGHALLLLCEAELGDPMQNLTNASYTAGDDAKAKGMWSTWGQGLTGPSMWKDAECVHPSLKGVMMPDTTVKPGNTDYQNAYLQYNEYIAYDVAQVRLRYLFRIKM